MSGRYPFNVGFYEMPPDDANQCLANTTLLPQLLRLRHLARRPRTRLFRRLRCSVDERRDLGAAGWLRRQNALGLGGRHGWTGLCAAWAGGSAQSTLLLVCQLTALCLGWLVYIRTC